MPLPKENGRYTYQDYCGWPDEERWEIIDGIAYDMTPAPNFHHQTISMRLSRIISTSLRGKKCIPCAAPADVVFSEYDVVQPDLFIVCDRSIITEKNIQGAPDVVFEILSPSSSKKDRWLKRALYEKYGVNEYIILYPDGNYAERFLLGEDDSFGPAELIEEENTLQLSTVPDVKIPLPEVFELDFLEEPPEVETGKP